MEIFVNDEAIETTLEDNDTIGSVLNQLTGWIESNGEFVISTKFDEQDISSGLPPALAEQKATSGGSISIQTCPAIEYRVRRITIMDDYLSLLEENLLKGSLQEIQNAAIEYPYIQQQLAEELGSGSSSNELDTIIPALMQENKEPTSEQRQTIAIIVQMIRSVLQDRKREILHPQESARVAAEQLLDLMPEIVEVSIQIQSNEQQTAMKTVFSVSELLGKLLRSLGVIENTAQEANKLEIANLKEREIGILDLLKEFEEAFAANDTVSVGDILEYEVAPVLEEFCHDILRAITDKTNGVEGS